MPRIKEFKVSDERRIAQLTVMMRASHPSLADFRIRDMVDNFIVFELTRTHIERFAAKHPNALDAVIVQAAREAASSELMKMRGEKTAKDYQKDLERAEANIQKGRIRYPTNLPKDFIAPFRK